MIGKNGFPATRSVECATDARAVRDARAPARGVNAVSVAIAIAIAIVVTTGRRMRGLLRW
jgi:hypothetical protein